MTRRLAAPGLALAVAAVVAVLSGCHSNPDRPVSPAASSSSGTSATPSATPTAAGGVPACALNQLKIVFSPTDNSAGHAHGVLTFANTSQQDCSLTGYATVVFDDPEAQQPMGKPASHNPSEPTGPAVSGVGGFSTADLTITDAGLVEGCTVVTATALLVTPPGLSDYQYVAIDPTPACQNDDIGLLDVSSNYIPPGS